MKHLCYCLTLSLSVILSSCRGRVEQAEFAAETSKRQNVDSSRVERLRCNAIYHWKTTFSPDSAELSFMEKHEVKRMYVRLFDVDLDTSPMDDFADPIPVGTTTFKGKAPEGMEVVPCVFITTRVLKFFGGPSLPMEGIPSLASKIYTRTKNMMDYNDLGQLSEIQLDCDWTESTRDIFYELCKKVKSLAVKDSVLTSATIRLHQLSSSPPPVDRGVLMVYNTGALRSSGTKDSILDYGDVKKYLGGKSLHYDIPLDFAFPVFGWGVLFRKGTFLCILHKTDFDNQEYYSSNNDGTYLVRQDHVLEGHSLYRGDRIRLEYPDAETIDRAAGLVASSVKDSLHGIILYHLDSHNLVKYTDDEIKRIYNH